MSYRIEDAGDSSAAEWDEFVRRQSGWTHFHLYGWRRVITRSFRHASDFLIARDARDAITGVLPLVRVRSMVFGDFLVSMPFLNYGGPLGEDGARAALVTHAADLARRRKVDLLELRCREQGPYELQASTRKITVILDLPAGGSDELWKSFDPKLRSQIRKPSKEGVEVRFGDGNLHDFYAVFAEHMRDLGTPVLPLRFFAEAQKAFGGEMILGVAYLNGAPVACGCGFEWDNEFEMTWASSLRQHAKLAANMGLYWAFIQRAMERGLSRFNFGRCTPGGGTHRFKKQWNSRDEQLWWYQLARSGVSATPSPDGKFSLGPRLWRHLPLKVANALGPSIVRNIP